MLLFIKPIYFSLNDVIYWLKPTIRYSRYLSLCSFPRPPGSGEQPQPADGPGAAGPHVPLSPRGGTPAQGAAHGCQAHTLH